MPRKSDKPALSEGAQLVTAADGRGCNVEERCPLAEGRRFLVCIPSTHGTRIVNKYPVDTAADARRVLAAHRRPGSSYWIADTRDPGARLSLDDLPDGGSG